MGPTTRLPPLHSLSRRRRSSHATVYRSLASSAGRTAITDATHVRIRRAGRAVVLAASPLCQPPRRRWPGLCLDGALHGEVDAGHRTRSHPWRGAGHDGALRDEVVVAWPVASTLDDAVRGRGHHGEVQVAMVLSVARSRSPSPLPRRRAPWRGRGRRCPSHSPFVFAAASHGKVEANRGGRRYSLIVRAGSLGS